MKHESSFWDYCLRCMNINNFLYLFVYLKILTFILKISLFFFLPGPDKIKQPTIEKTNLSRLHSHLTR